MTDAQAIAFWLGGISMLSVYVTWWWAIGSVLVCKRKGEP